MKKPFIVVVFLMSVITKPVAQTTDFFPLTIGTHFGYRFHEYSSQVDFDPLNPDYYVWSKSYMDGFEFYSVLDSVSQGDSAIVWSIEQRDSLLLTDSSSTGSSSSRWSLTTNVHSLVESKRGNHQLTNNDMRLWYMSPYSKMPVYRFADSFSDSLFVSFPFFLGSFFYSAQAYLTKGVGLTSYFFAYAQTSNTHHYELKVTSFLQSRVMRSVEYESRNAEDFYLRQNYPNPFNPSTTISFSIPSKSFITLSIYDILGRHITTLFHGVQSAGSHTISWDASRYPSGIYFCRIDLAGRSKTERLMLLK